jgi:autotransporter-associated beta strand protein
VNATFSVPPRLKFHSAGLLVALVVSWVLAMPASATTYNWTGGNSTAKLWEGTTNWSPTAATGGPGANDSIYQTTTGAVVRMDQSEAIKNITFTVGEQSSIIATANTPTLTVGNDITNIGAGVNNVIRGNATAASLLTLTDNGTLEETSTTNTATSTMALGNSQGSLSFTIKGLTTITSNGANTFLSMNAVSGSSFNGGIVFAPDQSAGVAELILSNLTTTAEASGGMTINVAYLDTSTTFGGSRVLGSQGTSSLGNTTTLNINGNAGVTDTYTGLILDDSTAGTNNLLSLIKSGNDTQIFTGASSYSGGTSVTGGILEAGISTNNNTGNGPFGIGMVSVNAGTLDLEGFNATQTGVQLISGVIEGSGVLTSGSNFDIESGSVSVSLADGVGAGTSSGVAGLNKTTTGDAILYGSNIYTGMTTISAGTLDVENISGSATGSASVSVTNTSSTSYGTLTGGSNLQETLDSSLEAGASYYNYFGSAGIMAGDVTVGQYAHLAPGEGGIGTITTEGTLTLQLGSVLDLEFDKATQSNDLIDTNNLTLNSGILVNLYKTGTLLAFDTPGLYNIINYTGTVSNFSNSDFTVTDQQTGYSYTFSNDMTDGYIQLTIASVPEPSTWSLLVMGAISLVLLPLRPKKTVPSRSPVDPDPVALSADSLAE